ncbi:hypothetical protein BSKO_02928 [Bryopsis sp. KO-2023]|nr:hypothetical protein BSKO_02928 [Bryopsis sp. KO-2023]
MSSDAGERDPDCPSFHLMPQSGWMNDPNGPIFFEGRYHMFYQHLSNSCEWNWGIVWGHASSKDLVHWEHHEIALKPTPGGLDADGCFSGCCVVNGEGVPTILYTGVRLRSSPDSVLPPQEHDLELPFIESQLKAEACTETGGMIKWKKSEKPLIALPPGSMGLTGWRDPFVFQRGDHSKNWIMLMGSGVKGEGGTVLVYEAPDLSSEWVLNGCLCTGDADTGAMWECPLLLKLKPLQVSRDTLPMHTLGLRNSLSGALDCEPTPPTELKEDGAEGKGLKKDYVDLGDGSDYLLCISPDAPTNPVICWIGDYEDEKFDLDNAKGPFRLDLGDILYAPNVTECSEGRTLLWGWLQERRKIGTYTYSGCLSVPRVLSSRGGSLFQEPCAEINHLRTGNSWRDHNIDVYPESPTPLQCVGGVSLDLEVTLERGMSNAAGLLLRSWHVAGEGCAAIVFDWDHRKLEVVFEAVNPETMEFCLDSETSRRIGGVIDFRPGDPLVLRVMIDHSVVEIFTGSGEVLSTRVYRGAPAYGNDPGVDFVAFGGNATVLRVEAYEMSSMWKESNFESDLDRIVGKAETQPVKTHAHTLTNG